MNTDFPHLTRSAKARNLSRSTPPADEVRAPKAPALARQACCCLGKSVVVTMMPVSEERPAPVDIHLCAHHYRASRATLAEAGAIVFDRGGRLVDSSTDAFDLV